MSFISVNEQCVSHIEKYARKLREIFPHIEHETDEQIEDGIYGLALTQSLTNIYEACMKVNSEELEDKLLPIIRKTKVARNIASHNYDAINWSIVKNNCRIVIKLAVPEFFEECYGICERHKRLTPDYTGDIE
ncbi:MAG: hypothetical protein LBR83_01065 [Clostridiales bacterium]|jgi:hypothetical protein|nr:hypothetical protein [Clostridiales bacterium]